MANEEVMLYSAQAEDEAPATTPEPVDNQITIKETERLYVKSPDYTNKKFEIDLTTNDVTLNEDNAEKVATAVGGENTDAYKAIDTIVKPSDTTVIFDAMPNDVTRNGLDELAADFADEEKSKDIISEAVAANLAKDYGYSGSAAPIVFDRLGPTSRMTALYGTPVQTTPRNRAVFGAADIGMRDQATSYPTEL